MKVDTILDIKAKKVTKALKNKGKVTLLIIHNTKKLKKEKQEELDEKLAIINKQKDINIKPIEEKDIFKTIDTIIDET